MAHEADLLVSLVANLPGSAVFVLDEDLRYLLAEGQALHDAGFTPEDLVGRTARQALGPDLAALYEPNLRAALDGTPFVVEHEAHGRAFVTHGRPLCDSHGRRALIVSHDITERRAAEAARRESEARWAFLVELNDRLRALADPEDLQFQAARALGKHLAASRVGYAEDAGDGVHITVTRNYVDAVAGIRGIEGRYRYDDYGPDLLRAFRAGRTVVRPDIANDPSLTDAEKQAHAVLGLGSTVNVPLTKNGRLVGVLFVHQDRPRAWRPAELQLVQDVAERTWAAVERTRAESALREREEKYRSLFLSIDEGSAVCDIIVDDAGAPIDYRFLEVNPRFEELTGLAGAVGRTARELVPFLEPHWVHTYARVALGGETLRFESWSEAMGRWFDVYGTPVGPVGRFALVFDDITERRQAERALRESEERFRLTVETAPQSVWVSGADGRLEYVNQYWTEYSGLDLAASADDDVLAAAIHPEDSAGVFGRWRQSLADGEPFDMEARLRSRDGDYRWFLIRTIPLRDEQGHIVHWYGVAADVHALRVAEQEAALARADAELAHRRIHRLQQLTARLAGALTPDEVADLLVSEVSAVVGADAAWVTQSGPPDLAGPLWLSTRRDVAEHAPHLVDVDPDVASAVVVSLVQDGRRVGTFCVCFHQERTVTPADRDFLLTATRLSSGVLARARAYAAEHQAAAILQESLLAHEPPRLTGAEVSVRYRPAAEQYKVGGDWYEVVVLPDGRVGLSVGDVVGSGIAAATAMGQLRSATTAIALEGTEPALLLQRLERFAERTPGAAYATTAYAVVDGARREVTYACAGHPPPLVVAADGTSGYLWDARSTPLGAAHSPGSHTQATAPLGPGCRLLIYSDGLVERRGEPIDRGLERLARIAAGLRELPLDRFADVLVERMLQDVPQNDDVALLAFEPAVLPAGLEVRIPARAGALAGLRRQLRTWLAGEGVDAGTVQTVLLACGEATANAVEHAYRAAPAGDVVVSVTRESAQTLLVTVRDFGSWRHTPSRRNRGRGRLIIRSIVEDVDYATGRDGTEVRMLIRAGGNP